MKKKIVTLLLVSTMAFGTLVGCGNNSNTDSNKSNVQEEKETTDTKEVESEKQEESVPEETAENEEAETGEQAEERSLAGIEQYMLDAGYLTGERSQKAAEMLGAIDGFGYECGVEIYQYDTNSDTYASVAAGEEIPLQGMDGYSVKFDAVNGEFALIFSNGEGGDQAIIDAFMAY